MTTFLQLQQEVQFHARQRDDLSTFVKGKINEAILDVMLLVEPPEFFSTYSITTVSGTPNYVLTSSDTLAVLDVTITSTNITLENRRLMRGDFREFDDGDQDFTASRNLGRPTKWFRYTNSIYFYDKVPDDNSGSNYAIRVRTLLRPTALSADADSFPLALEWKEPVVLRATEKMFALLGDAERKQLAADQFQEAVAAVVQRIQAIEKAYDRDAGMRATTHQHRPAVSGRQMR